ncbi:MAG: signal peptidase II, partial [Nannocystaceae bacterium]
MTQRQTGFLIALLALAFALSLDLWTKAWAWEHLKPASPGQPDNPVTVIEGLFYLKFGFNTGSAFSLLRDKSWARVFFIVVTFGALAYMAWLAATLPPKRKWVFVSIGFIAGGA